MIVAGSGEKVPLFIMYHTFSIDKRSGILLARAVVEGERGNPTRKDNAAHIVSHELETFRFVSLLLPPCISVPKLYAISREA